MHTSWMAGDSGQRDRRLRRRAETPRPGGVLSMTLQGPETPVERAGYSGHPETPGTLRWYSGLTPEPLHTLGEGQEIPGAGDSGLAGQKLRPGNVLQQ